jgi:hypothetical protein
MRKIPYFWLLVLPYLLYGLGTFLNTLVVTSNRGIMPVLCPLDFKHYVAELDEDIPYKSGEMMDQVHRVMKPDDHLKFLADWIVYPHGAYIESPGDQFIDLGNWMMTPFLWAWLALLWKRHQEEPHGHGRVPVAHSGSSVRYPIDM